MHKSSNLWGESHIGYKRKNNEDRFLIQELSRIVILAVADGLGGAGGEIAAQHVIDAFRDTEFSKDRLEKDLADALSKAEKQIFNNVKENPDLYGMGSTVTTAAVYQNMVAWIHVGDSRLKFIRLKICWTNVWEVRKLNRTRVYLLSKKTTAY
ncbi:MAG: hypothetical protein GY799_10815 [Desulfobulbaceae bacterium]|nr:hypothetical protein [Desulfobulbaceae bacterium]